MAIIVNGRHAGKTVEINSWANDWIMVDGLPAQESIFKPTRLKLDAVEIRRLRESIGDPIVGHFWREWALDDHGTFTCLRAPGERVVRHRRPR
jgi:hypothetical protein